MSSAPPHSSAPFARVRMWVLSMVALAVLYLLSAPPMLALVTGYHVRAYRDPMPPAWILTYFEPYEWLKENTPLRKPLTTYLRWWALWLRWYYS